MKLPRFIAAPLPGFGVDRMVIRQEVIKMLYSNAKIAKKPRVELTEPIRSRFFKEIFTGSVPQYSKTKGLSYSLVFNLVHGRIKSLSVKDYRIIFGEEPPPQEHKKVDGEYFRNMVKLWLYLNEQIPKMKLYSELAGMGDHERINHRIYSGETKSVDAVLEKQMEQKFLDNGLDRATIKQWLQEFSAEPPEDKVPYQSIRPILLYLESTLQVNPTRILHQWFERYESGQLKSVSKRAYLAALELKAKTLKAIESGQRSEIDKVREAIYGEKAGYTLYSEIAEELHFLRKNGGKKPKSYLGRGTNMYAKGQIKRVASWRARQIRSDCEAFIEQRQDLALSCLPPAYQKKQMDKLLTTLRACLAAKLFQQEGLLFENRILRPSLAMEHYKGTPDLIRFDMATSALGMKRKAFDLMVAQHCDIFRSIGTYRDKWYLPVRYLEELLKKDFFDIVMAKYERLAQRLDTNLRVPVCMN